MNRWLLCLLLLFTTQIFANIHWTIQGKLNETTLLTTITQTLEDGWHTYWKNPGDSGAKATITALTPGFIPENIQFPKPMIIPLDPFITYGYEGTITYTLPITLTQPTSKIQARFEWLECKDVCIPKETTLTLAIPTTIKPITYTPTHTANIRIEKHGKTIQFKLPKGTQNAAFFPYKNKQFNMKEITLSNDTLSIKLKNPNLTTIEGELFLAHHPPITIHQRAIKITPKIYGIILTLLGAFLGGLLLNIMPCVLPIIGIKALQLHQNPSESHIKDALSYFLGITLSLFSLYFILLGIKLTGTTIGWGFQLQSPLMVQSLILLFIAMMAINLDLIQIPLPKAASKSSTNMVLNGILTTLIATPCTAPFLGSALSIALFKSPVMGAFIFLFMSIGLALPMSLLILNPNHQIKLPKSGPWNEKIKFYLNFGFICTIGWLMWVLASQITQTSLLTFFSGSITLFCILLFRSKAPLKHPLIIIISTTIIGLIPFTTLNTPTKTWDNYSATLIQKFEETNVPFFIDVTAKWCITCQANKITVLNTKQAQQLFKEKNTQLLRADWTNKDPEITKLLQRFNQISIPTYIYFDGHSHEVFGDILTQKKLKEHLR